MFIHVQILLPIQVSQPYICKEYRFSIYVSFQSVESERLQF